MAPFASLQSTITTIVSKIISKSEQHHLANTLILTALILLLFLKPKVDADLISQQAVNLGSQHTSSLFIEKKGMV
jgi:hypothetical protein